MARKTKTITPKTDVALNRWCIEMAMRWPLVSNGGMSGSSYNQMPRIDSDADVISRANKIKAWINSAA